MSGKSFWFLGVAVVLATASTAQAQLPRFSINGGVAIPVRNEATFFNNGIHLGAALKLPLIPIQFEAGWDRMSGEGEGSDLTILNGGVAFPFSLTPALVPVSLYVIAGGGIYNTDAAATSTDVGINGGAGVRFKLAALAPFIEGRGVLIFSEANKFTYLTASVGLRF